MTQPLTTISKIVEDKAAELLTLHEGYETKPYEDTVGKMTIGVGFNLDVGLYPEEIDFILRNRINRIDRQLSTYKVYKNLDPIRKVVLIDMAYNLGMDGLRKFKLMWAALEIKDYKLAAKEMLDSKWARQVGERAWQLARMMESGTDSS